jgi:hypothetical protein
MSSSNINNNKCSYLTCEVLLIILSSIILVGSILTYIVFAIIGLINTPLEEQYNLCTTSNLWIYSIVSLLVLSNNILNIPKLNTNKILVIRLLILIIMIIWGIYEFIIVNCVNNLRYTILYKVTIIYWICQITFFCSILYIICKYYCNNLSNNNLSNNNLSNNSLYNLTV